MMSATPRKNGTVNVAKLSLDSIRTDAARLNALAQSPSTSPMFPAAPLHPQNPAAPESPRRAGKREHARLRLGSIEPFLHGKGLRCPVSLQ